MIRDGVGTCGVSDHVMDDVLAKFVVNCGGPPGGNYLVGYAGAGVESYRSPEMGPAGRGGHVGEHLGIRFGIGGSVGVILTPEDIRQASQGKRQMEEEVLEQAKRSRHATSTLQDALRRTPDGVRSQLNGYGVQRAHHWNSGPVQRGERVAQLVNAVG